LPKEVTDLAFNILLKLEKKDYSYFNSSEQLHIGFNKKKENDFSHLEELSSSIKSIDLNNISPNEALQKLYEIQKKIEEVDNE